MRSHSYVFFLLILLSVTTAWSAPNYARCKQSYLAIADQKGTSPTRLRGDPRNGGFAHGIEAAEIQEIARSFSTENHPIFALEGKNLDTVLLNASYRTGFWDKIGVIVRDLVGSHFFNDANHRITYTVVKKLMERNGVHPVSDELLYNVISKVGRSAPGFTSAEDIAKALRGY